MPEGHVIHRLAGELERSFAGATVAVTSPQGRFAREAALLDRTALRGAQAYGKHLFIDFGDDALVHVHLGLIGRLEFSASDGDGEVQAGDAQPGDDAVQPGDAQPGDDAVQPGATQPRSDSTARLRISRGNRTAVLRGPQTCDLLTRAQVAQIVAALGPDPLRADADPDQGWRRVHASSRSIAALLLDQRVAAGVGNIFRAEVLFRHGTAPELPGRRVPKPLWDALWDDLVALMAVGLERGRIDTVRPEHEPAAMGRPPRVDRHGGEVYVYRRAGQPCLVCGTPVRSRSLDGRNLYWCPACQR